MGGGLCKPTKNKCIAPVERGDWKGKRKKMGLFLWNGRLFFVDVNKKSAADMVIYDYWHKKWLKRLTTGNYSCIMAYIYSRPCFCRRGQPQ